MPLDNNEDKIDLDQIISEFINCVNEDVDPSKTTDPNVKRVKIIRADSFCWGSKKDS